MNHIGPPPNHSIDTVSMALYTNHTINTVNMNISLKLINNN